MANPNSRDVSLRILIDTLGEENVELLRKAFIDLGRQGEATAEETQQLVTQLDRLSEQAATIQSLQSLGAASEQLAQDQTKAEVALAKVAQALREQRTAVEAARAAQQAARETLTQTQVAYRQAGDDIKLFNAGQDTASRKTDEYRQELQRLIAVQGQRKQAEIEARAAMQAANAEVTEAVSAQGRLESAQSRAAKAAQAAADAADQQQRTFRQAQASAEALGVSTEDLVGAELRLVDALNDVRLEGLQAQTMARLLAAAQQQLMVETQDAAVAQRELASALQQADLDRAAADTRALAQASQLLAAEQEFAAESARRVAEAQRDAAVAAERLQEAQRDEFARQLAVAQGLLTTELELQADVARRAAVAEQQLADSQERAAASAREAAAAAQQANQALAQAFGVVGVRSVQSLEQEIQQVRVALDTIRTSGQVAGRALDGAFAAGEARINELQREIREVTNSLTLADRASNLFKNSLGQIAAGNIIADGVGYLVNKVKELGRAFIDVVTQTESTRKALTAIYKDTGTAAQQMEFLRNTATAAGVSIAGISTDFVRFSAATQASNIPLNDTNELFTAVTRAASSLGLGAEKTSLALNALGQVASKSVVSMEELRQQLGDAIPGALTLTAKGLGVTDAELIKLVESGQLAARDFFPAFTKGLSTMQGETDGLRQTWERFKNVFTLGAQAAEANGAISLLTGGLKVFGGLLGSLVLGLSVISEALLTVGRAAILFFETLRGNGAEALGFFNQESAKMVERLGAQADAFNFMLNPTEELRQKMEATATANRQLGTEAQAAAGSLRINADALEENARAATSTEAGQLAASNAAQIAGDSAANASGKWVQLNTRMVELAKQQEQNVVIAEKEAKAIATQAQTIEQIAKLRGDERGVLEASAKAAQMNAAALDRVAVAREGEAAVLRVQLAEMVRMANAQDGSLKLREQEILKIQEKAEVLDAEAQSARNAAQAATLASKQRELDIRLAEDNAAAVDQLRIARDDANIALELAISLEREGLATKQQVSALEIQAAQAVALYRDAVEDKVGAIERAASAQAAALQIDQARVSVAQAHYESLAREAEALGNTTLATSYRIDAKRKEIEAVQIATRIKLLELDADKQAVEIQIAALDPQDKLYAAKKQELEIRLQLIKAKQIEAGASADVIRGLQNEITQLTNGTAARSNSTSGIDRDTSSRYKNVDSINAQTAALEKQNTTSDGFAKNKDGSAAGGFNNTLPVDKAFNVLFNGAGAGDAAYLKEAQAQALRARDQLDAMRQVNAGSVSARAMDDTLALVRATTRALEESGIAGTSAGSPRNTNGTAGINTTHTVKIDMQGRVTPINMASRQDADNLTSVLASLGNAASTAS